MNILIVGGNGFIGSHLVDQLLTAGHYVRVFDRARERYRPPLPQVDYRFGNLADPFALAEALAGMAAVFHLASSTVPGTSNMEPALDVQENLVGTLSLLEQMSKMNVRRIIFFSSGGTVYGNPERIPVPETHPLRPLCSYGIVKVACEKYLEMFQDLHGFLPVILRPANAYGPREGHLGIQGVISTFLLKAWRNEPITVWGDGEVVRDFIHVADIVRLCQQAAESAICGTFNIGSGQGCSIRQLLELLNQVTGKKNVVHFVPGRSFDVHEVILDVSKARGEFGWEPAVSLADGLQQHWQWLLSNKESLATAVGK